MQLNQANEGLSDLDVDPSLFPPNPSFPDGPYIPGGNFPYYPLDMRYYTNAPMPDSRHVSWTQPLVQNGQNGAYDPNNPACSPDPAPFIHDVDLPIQDNGLSLPVDGALPCITPLPLPRPLPLPKAASKSILKRPRDAPHRTESQSTSASACDPSSDESEQAFKKQCSDFSQLTSSIHGLLDLLVKSQVNQSTSTNLSSVGAQAAIASTVANSVNNKTMAGPMKDLNGTWSLHDNATAASKCMVCIERFDITFIVLFFLFSIISHL